MTQTELDFDHQPIAPIDPHIDRRDVKRLTGQNAAIIERLKRGKSSARELATISLKYTSRISDCRRAHYVIECTRDDDGGTWYELSSEPTT